MMFRTGKNLFSFGVLLFAAALYVMPAQAQASAPYREVSIILAGEGQSALDAGEYNTALFKFEQALVADPANVAGYVGLGQLYYAVDSFTLSQKYFEIALSLTPTDMRILELAAYTHMAAEAPDEVEKIRAKMTTICISGPCEELARLNQALEAESAESKEEKEKN